MDSSRKPLATRSNLSRLPLPGSRQKRARSPEDEVPSGGKKSRLEVPPPNQTTKPARSLSSSTLTAARNSAAARSKLKRTESSSSVNKRSTAPVTSKNLRTTEVQKSFNFRAPAKPQTSMTVRPRAPPTSAASKAVNQSLNATVVSTGAPKKRPAWDLKGRLQDMEAHMQRQAKDSSSLQGQLTQYNDRIVQLESQNQKLSGDVVEKEMASETAVKEIQELKNKLNAAEQEFETTKRTLQREIDDLQFQKSTLDRQKITLEGELAASMKEISGLKATVAEMTSAQATVRAELETAKLQLDAAFKDISNLKQTVQDRDNTLKIRDESIESYQEKERNHETERRKLHNTIQELKGNIRVFCRIRPLLGDELLGNDGVINHMNFPDMDGKVLEMDKLSDMSVNESVLNSTKGGRAVSKYEFSFDRVFQPESSQADVFEEISQLVQSALDGYNVCIFAYGQTGSGKTFTMEGSLQSDETLGMIPRAVRQIFSSALHLQQKGWKYTFQAAMLEIYNETIRDLLGKGKEEKHEIKMCGKGDSDVYVSGLTVVDVTSEDKVLNLLRKATENRAVAETKCNERSSRSHSVFQLRLTGENSITGESCKGILNLVDLAGSERVKDSGSEGQRLIEAQNINKSLSNLGNVIMALGNKDKHVPYRNSKLTYLLQNSLGGNSKTLMFVNVSPKEECFGESLNSLRFATKVNQCNIGTAQKKK
ncbi:carboxy-terminal kinesin 2 isoform X2 [Aplysia californica]|uniref:Carboxy-terminal kinesin 2 isoform X2 n=1 Tax=Aplysia californica TaxID=6500 RepID=A0ABM0JUZ2_APLCA|nr:carboxy-terminal kinesin 2 isoform X2 [Aplysia californica]